MNHNDRKCFVNIDSESEADLEMPVYRIFTLETFVDCLVNSNLTLVKPKLWDDPFENFILNGTARDEKNNRTVVFTNHKEKVHGQCWTMNEETDFMWRVYAPHKDGIKVKTSVKRILKEVIIPFNKSPNYFLFGKVNYSEEKSIKDYFESTPISKALWTDGEGRGMGRTLFIKRREFEPENEFRIVYWSETIHGEASEIMQFSIDPNKLFEEVVVDPRINPVKFDSYKKLFEKLGYQNKISKSELYNMPRIRLKL